MATRSGLTLEQFLAMEETKPASEYACGEVFQKPMPDIPHSAIQGFLMVVLYPYLKQTGIGRAFIELRCIFGPPGRERIYVPDLVYVAGERIGSERHLHVAPDLAVEVLSPDQHMPAFLDKIQFYLLYGVRLVWVIDPATATVAVEAPGQEARILRSGDALDGGEVLPGFSVPVTDIFAEMRMEEAP
jgi:Uma2 family endonuclease